jgi:hypothetical protein
MKKRCRCEQKKRRQPVLLRKSQAASQRILLHPAVKSFSRARKGVSDPEPPWRRLNCIMCAPLSGKNRSFDLLLLQNRMHKRQTAFIAATFGRLIFPKSTFVQLANCVLRQPENDKRPGSVLPRQIHPAAAVRYRRRLAIFLISGMRISPQRAPSRRLKSIFN